ncbi:vesicle transport protein, Use1 [Artemisia annua]|uniref:Vesicle transport protein, Use1 n=1 Tax=Artemisia annua TaxID=35608 RepID=A0A2U1LRE5_ARTAN|nr:vesicle transport protein, Use1 [Artemisia annua]
MGLSKTEINLKRLLAAAPQQQNKAKLMHYVATLREQLEQLSMEKTSEGFNRVSKALVSDYSDKIEAIAAKLASPVLDTAAFPELRVNTSFKENVSKDEEESIILSPGLRRRLVASSVEHKGQDTFESSESSSPVKLDAAAQAHITKHRKLQEDLTDEMVVLARQLKESSLTMNKSIQNTERILDSTEKAVEHSLATTGRANTQAMAIYSQGSKTSCFTWLLMFVMTCIFVMVVLLIKAT